MNRAEFMRQLESLLQNISRTEREEALQYYNDYFDDAGAENEREVIEALGNPARVAENIKRDLTVNGGGAGGFARQDRDEEYDYRNEDGQGNSVRNPVVRYKENEDAKAGDEGCDPASGKAQDGAANTAKKEPMPAWQIALLIAAGIVLTPIALGLVSGLASAVFGLFVGWFSLILGFGVAAVVLILLLFVLVVAGFMCIAESPLAAVAVMGGGLICGGLGILFLMLTVAMAGIVTPAIFRGCGKLWHWIADKRKKEALA